VGREKVGARAPSSDSISAKTGQPTDVLEPHKVRWLVNMQAVAKQTEGRQKKKQWKETTTTYHYEAQFKMWVVHANNWATMTSFYTSKGRITWHYKWSQTLQQCLSPLSTDESPWGESKDMQKKNTTELGFCNYILKRSKTPTTTSFKCVSTMVGCISWVPRTANNLGNTGSHVYRSKQNL
jgi:hypothetical protein